MADIGPEDARHHRKKDAEATDENSGYSIEGDTPPAEGLGVGPTNKELDVESSDRPQGKIWIAIIGVFIVLFVLLWVIGAAVGIL